MSVLTDFVQALELRSEALPPNKGGFWAVRMTEEDYIWILEDGETHDMLGYTRFGRPLFRGHVIIEDDDLETIHP